MEETLEEAAELYLVTNGVKYFKQDTISGIKFGAKWQAERMYTEEDMKYAYTQGARLVLISQSDLALRKGKFPTPDEWFEQHKK